MFLYAVSSPVSIKDDSDHYIYSNNESIRILDTI